ncbi:enoyl-CoA hydratase/isomerase family protein [Caenimonas soli]|uniref:enoyl-CoA hydratase/isomerase family protein n=1 Tax=Caenimonas soli TaxID=2735555 RepID=UPI0015549CA5|nr:enoyl-CoA hydratase/isomerase family protein [Caenimonas soli]NPC58544.1 enoyl-CoA hydratase/isomerase family protein [Caenimonas soli]
MTTEAEVLVHSAAGVTSIALHRPEKGNSLNATIVEALAAAVRSCYHGGTRLLALQGSGRHFRTGFDLSRLDDETDDTLLARFIRVELLLQDIRFAPFTTVAIASGGALGAGADLFCACEQCWGHENASFAFPGAGFGLVLGSSRLAHTVGAATARAWIRAGTTIDAASALRAGLATRALDAGEPEAALADLATQSQRLAPETQKAVHHATAKADEASRAHDLRELVLSASSAGLKARIAAYRAGLRLDPQTRH